MSRKAFYMITILLTVTISLMIIGCSPTETTVSSTPSQNKQPVEITSVTGPIPPFNPGGPVVKITLKNTALEPIISLTAGLELSRSFGFNFDLSSANPLAPGASVSALLTLIGGGFSDNQSYPLTVSGTLQSGNKFAFTNQVQIIPPK